MSETGFKFKSTEFEGPIDLLLTLVEKKKLHISRVSLAEVTDEYIAYIEKLGGLPIEETASFLSVASTLLLIKSIALLPRFEVTEEEKMSIEDLEHRLKVYKLMKSQTKKVEEQFSGPSIYFQSQTKNLDSVFSPSKDLSLDSITDAVKSLVNVLPQSKVLKEVVVRQVKKIEDVISELTERVQRNLKLSFKDFAGMGREEKVNVVVSFLAMLELVKQGVVNVNQDKHFSDIDIETAEANLPMYN